ncbi:MAG TPA: glycosyltransferase, partial [Edaphobacter sp.]|nr:glycosyltransferase [Edaphobacter sp.]
IATCVGGVPELIDHGRNGMFFEIGDVAAMAEAAVALLNDPDRLQQMSEAARQTAQENFCTTRIIPLYEAYYQRVLDRTQ